MVEQTIDVDAPLRNVYNQWTQFEEFPNFMEGVEDIRQIDDRHCHWRTKIAGVRREFDTEIVDQLPDERIAWRTTGGDVRQKGVVTFLSLDPEHTRVRLAMEMEPEGMAEKAGDALGFLDRRVKGDLKRFKGFIEDHGHETGQWRGRIRPTDQSTPGGTSSGELPPYGLRDGDPMGGPAGGPSSRPAPETWDLPPEPGEPGMR
ncbi:SRPBCC family protein [Streptomyces sp. NPDC048330]|uniref:SRPBCC family protein n=1 Tax=Streptomyces sp. NPDC048330 TaxID=3365533 RepID=UPI003720A72D